MLPIDAWVKCPVVVMNKQGDRSPGWYEKVLDGYRVTEERYRPRNGVTYCNIFAQDVMVAMCAPLPSKTANAIIADLRMGAVSGWKQVTEDVARANANAGKPTLVTWYNDAGPRGHIAVVRVSPKNIEIANVGRANFARGPIQLGFGKRPVEFWAHE